MEDIRADVAIVGFGPVGAMAAVLLGRAGVDTVVLDKRVDLYPMPRAVAADDEVLRILTAAGVEKAIADMVPARGVRFLNDAGRRLLTVGFEGPLPEWPGLALYRQPDLERVLRQEAERWPSVRTHLGVAANGLAQDEDGVTVSLDDGTSVRAQYVLGCDGARSGVRSWMGVPAAGRDASRSWVVVDAAGAPPAWVDRHHVTYLCEPRQAAVWMPTPGGWRLEVLLPSPAGPDRLVDVPEARRLAGPLLPSSVDTVERAAVYRFATRTAARWRVGRVLLAGDAAHTMPPFTGQGLAAGLRDIHNLAWKVALVVAQQARPEILDSYEPERRPHLRRMTTLTRFTGAVVTAPPGIAVARDAGLRGLAGAPGVGPWFTSGRVRSPQSLSRSAWPALPGATRRGGQLVPCARVRTRAGEVRRLDDVLQPGFALLGGDLNPLTHLSARGHRLFERVGGSAVSVVATGGSEPGSSALEDLDDTLLGVLAPGEVMIVRPDLVVAGVVRASRAAEGWLALTDRLALT